jgi:hypothetical protein
MQVRHEWEPVKLLSFQKFQNTLEKCPLTATFIDELVPIFHFISKQASGAASSLARYITDYVAAKIGPLQGSSRNFAEWTLQGAIFYILMRECLASSFFHYWLVIYVHHCP